MGVNVKYVKEYLHWDFQKLLQCEIVDAEKGQKLRHFNQWGILTLRCRRLERVRNAINVVGPGTSFAILACVGFSIFLVS